MSEWLALYRAKLLILACLLGGGGVAFLVAQSADPGTGMLILAGGVAAGLATGLLLVKALGWTDAE